MNISRASEQLGVESSQASGSQEDQSRGLELSDLHARPAEIGTPARRFGLRLNTKMSYQPLSSKDPEERKGYGSTDSTPAASPTALLIENVVLEDFERPRTSNPFLDPETAEYWKGVYDGCDYECRHVFDPTLTWSKKEEEDLVKKLDWKVCLWAVCAHSKATTFMQQWR